MNASPAPPRGPRFLPAWMRTYQRGWLPQDAMAGTIVAIMLVPQAMGYALIAGLPPQVGLYASILPLLLYAWFGSSRVLAVGPVALVSLLVASATSELAAGDADRAVALALALAAGVGLLQVLLSLLRAGFLVNFLSHPVISGFTSAAALVIAASQLKHLLGIELARGDAPYEFFAALATHLGDAHPRTLAVGATAVLVLLAFRFLLAPLLRRKLGSGARAELCVRAGPLVVLALGTALSAGLDLARGGVRVVGVIPSGLPPLALPVFSPEMTALLPAVLAIGLVGYLESFAVAQALAARRREHVDPNRELLGLGLANLGASCSGGYPVTGGFSRSVVNAAAGAQSGLASILSALLVALTVLFLTPWLEALPMAVLAAVIVVAVVSLIDVRGAARTFRYSPLDGLSLLVTFVSVLVFGIEMGIAIGAFISLFFLIARSTRPHLAVVGRVPGTEHFRNIRRHDVEQEPHVLALRMDESLQFANARALEQAVIDGVAASPERCHVLLICSAINFIDSSGLETLYSLHEQLSAAGVSFSLAEVKGPVADKLAAEGFFEALGPEQVFLSTDLAMRALSVRPCPPPAAVP